MSSHLSVTFDESSLRSNSSSPTSSYTPSFDSSVSEDFISEDYIIHQRNFLLSLNSGSLVKWTFFVICMEYRDSVIQKCNSKEILSANEELPNLHIPHQEENQQELRDYFDDELWQDMKFTLNIRSRTCLQFIACQQQDFRQRRTEIKNFLKNYFTDGVLEKIMHNILSTLTAIKAYFPKTTILRIHSHNYVDSIIKSFFPKAKKQLQTGQAGHQDHLLERRNDSILALLDQNLILPELMYAEIKPSKARADLINQDLVTLGKTMRASKDCLLDLINGINWRIHVPEGPTTWGNSWMFFRPLITIWLIGSREQGG
ncbi:hypothetical protein RhiirA1_455008 [Rhizophagus irregularis]|uniref:Uncharacterized protein n=1 Tax=Rhizophagus irregularis TaxID=588596 RepID=A0A2I1F410_9GLOM|nr:hypothetical protein RhiirA1_455008 [Rhizophagus irregularis]PKY29105.1 hypothetical protein RhiirB3_445599 [Rhizophagus irregularis]